MDNSGKVLLTLGLGAVGAAGMWWWLRGRVVSAPQSLPDPESFKTPVAKVAKLYLYPVKSCHRIELESSKCLTRGLKYDRQVANYVQTNSIKFPIEDVLIRKAQGDPPPTLPSPLPRPSQNDLM